MKKYSIVVYIIPINKKKGSVWPKNQKRQLSNNTTDRAFLYVLNDYFFILM